MIVSSYTMGDGATGCAHSAIASGNRLSEPIPAVPGFVPMLGAVDDKDTTPSKVTSPTLKNFVYLIGGLAIGLFLVTQFARPRVG